MSYLGTKKADHDFFLIQFFNYLCDRIFPLRWRLNHSYRRGGGGGRLRKWKINLVAILKIVLGTGCCVAFQWSYALCSGTNCSCSVTVMPVNFGAYNPFSTQPTTGLGKITVNCVAQIPGQVSYTISLDAGAGRFAGRAMILGARSLQYNLYTDSAYQFIWGDGSVGTYVVSDNYAMIQGNNSKIYPIFGKIPSAQKVPAGVYTDTLTLTVDY